MTNEQRKLLDQFRKVFRNPNDRIEVFIDAANLFATTKRLKLTIDFCKLLELFHTQGNLIRISYYTALVPGTEHDPLRPLIDYLTYNGYNLVTKDAKTFTDKETGQVTIKGNVDMDIAVDAMKAIGHIDHAVFLTGDGDFKSLVHALQENRIRVTAISSVKTNPAMCADELRKQVDHFIELQDLRILVEKK